MLAGLATCGAVAIAAPAFFGLLYKTSYAGAAGIAQWLVIYTWCTVLNAGIAQVRIALGDSKVLFIANVIQTSGIGLAVLGYLASGWLQIPGLIGFILGLALGPIFSHLYLVSRLPAKRGAVIRQGVIRSFELLAFVAFARLLLWILPLAPSSVGEYVVRLIIAGAGCLVVGGLLYVSLFGRRLPWAGRQAARVADAPPEVL
jgi:hypothetical protein